MNSLSWFLYIVDVVGSLGGALSFFTGFMFIAVLTFALYGAANRSFSQSYPELASSKKEAVIAKNVFASLPKYIKITIVMVLFDTLIPSTRTLYMIAGSEFSEDAIMSETGKRVQDAINKKLDEYLTEK